MHGSARYLAPCVAALLLGSTTGLADGASAPAGSLAAIETAKRSAVLELYAIESSLSDARAGLADNARRERALAQAHDRAVAHAAVLHRSLAATQRRIATLLRRLYVEGSPEPVEVLLGARSLSAVLDGVDVLERATRRNRELAAEARSRSAELDGELRRLARARDALAGARVRAETLARALEAAAREKRSTLAALERRENLTRARIAAVEAQARAAERASRRLARPSGTPAPAVATIDASEPQPSAAETREAADIEPADSGASSETPPAQPVEPGDTRTLVVDAVAYHLPGHTASGLPVGVGVIAVDPAVIPLGTRVYVPGYGPAVAADTGSAIRGAIIDLWMPSTEAARAWGRRTVTITVYG
ncbi:MAG TPA: 3D domain-containing protein [Gaiella sp.]|nr:3D domain-containing protein [Gaiella sp.]